MKFVNTFVIVALLLLGAFYAALYVNMRLPVYQAWLTSATLTTFILYGVDKYLARIKRFTVRVPEIVLNLLALVGGFAGGWLGMLVWRHKINVRKHWNVLAFLVAGTLIHGAAIYVFLLGGRLPLPWL